MDKRKEMIALEIMNCKNNIKFYENEIENMEEKLEELEKLRQRDAFY